jgi:hypothetical protein
MPEAAVDEDDHALAGKDDVATPTQIRERIVDAEPKAQPVKG